MLTVSRPLLLVLEDLHWGDYATLDLLTYLARRLGPSRLLVLATYRPVEVLLRGHPLQTVKQELLLHGQGVELPLELLTAEQVAQYLTLRCAAGADLPPTSRELAQIMHERTDGHPLFMVTIVEHLLHRGVLREGPGQWEVEPEAAAAVLEVPASMRQMIEQQFDRLSPEEQRTLEVASVVGGTCAVAAVAAGLDLAMETVEDCCAGLAQRGHFLVASGIEAWPDGTVTERYDWRHALHQEVVYMRVPEVRRLRLHRRIGAREETGYGAQAGAHAAELAVHFRARAGLSARRAVSAASRGQCPAALCLSGGGQPPHARARATRLAAGDAGTSAPGARPPGGSGRGIDGDPGICRLPTWNAPTPGPGSCVSSSATRRTVPGAAGVELALSDARGLADGVPTRGAVAPPGPDPARPGAPPARPLSDGDGLVLSGRASPGPDPSHAGPGAL